MKIVSIDIEKQKMVVGFDFWEIEILGYDVKLQMDVSGNFFKVLSGILDDAVKSVFSVNFDYGVKTLIDEGDGMYYYEIMPYEERFNEFVLSEITKSGRKWIIYKNYI